SAGRAPGPLPRPDYQSCGGVVRCARDRRQDRARGLRPEFPGKTSHAHLRPRASFLFLPDKCLFPRRSGGRLRDLPQLVLLIALATDFVSSRTLRRSIHSGSMTNLWHLFIIFCGGASRTVGLVAGVIWVWMPRVPLTSAR